ncbi:CCT domain [Plasmopara halstedii]|uniref:CCT domain n=1 Tax=Plasmopara halstedii TaxID=4781 RepID=A0A0P1AW07_PLAHL|nr:CCT domain [Plasmopara halstedii]CEG45616.1 CCT domain [Plasmopara halstedii]|eukprot:XP_024581985.1 CCT domain [Plasmopara halstedii]
MLCDSGKMTEWQSTTDFVKVRNAWNAVANTMSACIRTAELAVKADDSKLIYDVDDMLIGLVDEIKTSPSCDEVVELDTDKEDMHASWIDILDDDVVNMSDLSAAFDSMSKEQEKVEIVGHSNEEMDESDRDNNDTPRVKIIPSAPMWASMAPLDPRSCIRTPMFGKMDTRIPCIQVPRIDMAFSNNRVVMMAAGTPSFSYPKSQMRPQCEKTEIAACQQKSKTCWICKSSKSPEKKRALHRYHEKRTRRNWKRGPRYTGRSDVATSRIRNGGRFIRTTRWI